jgi:hypothetical protein
MSELFPHAQFHPFLTHEAFIILWRLGGLCAHPWCI